MSREQVELSILKILRVSGIAFFFLITAFPFFWMVVLSFRPLDQVIQNPVALPTWEQISSLRTYKGVWFEQHLGDFVVNSLIVSLSTVILNLILAILGAYAITRLKFRGRDALSIGILLIYVFPTVIVAVPLFVVFTRLGLRGSLVGVILVYLASTLPVALYMLRSYFQTIPGELEEAGLIDGLNRLGVIWRITLPLAAPAIAAVGLYVFMIAWNEFLFAYLWLLERPDAWTLSLGVQQLDSQEIPKTWLMAGSVIISVPVIILFFFAERFLTEGLTAGSVKG
ncbi:MAG: carbohydrate ABC transporter permease [Anaerolineae bacterium]|nr:carbohydrate ABC transporter permease [Anaerolineae bacterium]